MLKSSILGICDKDRLIFYREKNGYFDRFRPVFEKHWQSLNDAEVFRQLKLLIGKEVVKGKGWKLMKKLKLYLDTSSIGFLDEKALPNEMRDTFDYTEWHQKLWDGLSIDEIHAMGVELERLTRKS